METTYPILLVGPVSAYPAKLVESARCGCLFLDCGNHGAYGYNTDADYERAKACGVAVRCEREALLRDALRSFRRAMRRHKKRCMRLGFVQCAGTMAVISDGGSTDAEKNEQMMLRCIEYGKTLRGTFHEAKQINFFYKLAADACAKLTTRHQQR